MSHHYHHHHGASGHRSTQHQQHLRNLTHYPAAPSASPTPTPTAPDHIRSRSNPGALASTSGVILHQPYPNSVGIQSAQAQYAQPTPSSSAVAPPPPIPTHTRPVDMPVSPVRPGSTHYGSDPFSLSQYSLQRSMTPGPYMHSSHPIPIHSTSPPAAAQYPNYLDLPKSPPKENKCQYPNCEASFDRRYDLKRHILSRHQEPDFQCPFCMKKLSRSDALTRHFGTCANRAAVLAAQHPRPTQ